MTKPTLESISVCWKAPSNLAIVKYWGKKGIQEPLNPSISFALEKSYTKTQVSVAPSDEGGFSFHLNGESKTAFNMKIEQFLERAKPFLPFLKNHHLKIESSNTFPHSSGIASSASSMSALAFCLTSLHQISQNKSADVVDKLMVSGLARLGSGSACRSVYGGWSLWGKTPHLKNSSNIYALPLVEEINPVFATLQDTILLIDTNAKKVSSSKGHQLMENHPYRDARIEQANMNTNKLLNILKNGELMDFFDLAETEALSLHGLMMSSNPSYTLLHPNTLKVIELIKEKRTKDGFPVGFSLDAGSNIHLLYPEAQKNQVVEWLGSELQQFCSGGKMIHDKVGNGPTKTTK